ncbi:MAG: spore coat U domain-containing protein [Hyphomonas sp.]|nr:spore coat U domain-containing protein [Hyphomonas sp.]
MHTHDKILRRWLKPWRLLLLAWAATLIPTGLASAKCTGIGCSCSVSANPLDFGTYNPIDSNNVDATGDVSVTCGALILGVNISYKLALNSGISGDPLNRVMSNGGNTMNYNLYTNSGRTIVWGDGTGGTGTFSNSYILSLIFSRTDHFPIYGRAPTGQNIPPGSYSDTLVATVIF